MTREQAMQRLRRVVDSHDNQSAAAVALGISPQHLCDLLKGRRGMGPKLLRLLGLERVEMYREVSK